MDSSRISTGWFGVPGEERRSTLVHVVKDGKPMCGTQLGEDQQYQWCAHGAVLDYVECQRCKKIAKDLLESKLTDEVREGF